MFINITIKNLFKKETFQDSYFIKFKIVIKNKYKYKS